MKKFYLLILMVLLCFSSTRSFAGDGLGTDDLLFYKNHLGIAAGLNQPTLVKPITGGNDFHFKGLPGCFVGFRYTANFHRNFAIITGADAGIQTFNYNFSSTHISANVTWNEPYLGVPLLVNPRILINHKHVLGLQAGASFHYFVPSMHSASYRDNANANNQEVLEVNFKMAQANPYIQPEVGLDYGLVLKNLNILSFNVHYSIGVKDFFKGNYNWRENDFTKEKGTIQSTNNYLNVGFVYTFTKAAHLRQKMLDNKLEPINGD